MKQRQPAGDPALAALGSRIATRRKTKGFTQEDLAHEAGIALRSLQTAESGRLNPSYLTLRKIAAGLETSVARLLTDL
jgi:XRE family aerobic/anaerobic benzoate catabolism transcriptional regulator